MSLFTGLRLATLQRPALFRLPTRLIQTSTAINAKKNKNTPPQGPAVNSGTYAYVLKDVTKIVDNKRVIFKEISLSFYHGSKIGVIGNNGSGKSTLMKIIAGLDKEYTGEAFSAPGRTVGYLPQEPYLDPAKDVFSNVMDGLKEKKELLDRFEEISNKLGEEGADFDSLVEEQGEIQGRIDELDCWNLQRDIEIAMEALRCPPGNSSVVNLSGGEKRRVALCRLLLEQPDILVLDEPTNHLDAESVQWLERFLQEYKGTLLLVTHDRYFLDNVVQWILEIDRGNLLPFKGSYSLWLEKKKERLELEKKQETSMSKVLERELEWIRQTPGARRKKNKARLDRYEELVERSKTTNYSMNQIVIPPGPRLGDQVIDFMNVSYALDDRLLMENLSFKLPRGAILGIIGPNGSGKTTLFKLVAEELKPTTGQIDLGKTVKLGYVSQSRHSLDNTKTVFQEISDGQEYFELGNGQKVNTRAFIATFNFRGPAQERMVGNLSGGERNRLHLAKMLREGCNLLMLDEPTNDLDVDTLRSLEEALPEFPGCVMVISHDRWFLNRICTHILAFEGNSQVVFFEGNYADYEADRVQRLGNQRPTRIKYKKAIIQ